MRGGFHIRYVRHCVSPSSDMCAVPLARAFELAKHLRRVFDHRHDPPVVEPSGANDAEHARDAMVAVSNGAAIIDDPDREKSLFSEPMKILTPSPVSARCRSSITSVLVSRSANSVRIRSRSSEACKSPSRVAWPRTMSWSRDCQRRTTRRDQLRPGGRRFRRVPGARFDAPPRFPLSPRTMFVLECEH